MSDELTKYYVSFKYYTDGSSINGFGRQLMRFDENPYTEKNMIKIEDFIKKDQGFDSVMIVYIQELAND